MATALAVNGLDPAALQEASNRFAKIREHLRSKGVEGLVEMVVALAERDSSTELFVQLAMTEGLLTDAWIVVNSHGCSDLLMGQLAELSEQSHPVEALKAYTDCVERMLRLGGLINYENAYRTIERMRCIREGLGEAVQHAAYLADLKSRHKAKRNFMTLFTAKGA